LPERVARSWPDFTPLRSDPTRLAALLGQFDWLGRGGLPATFQPGCRSHGSRQALERKLDSRDARCGRCWLRPISASRPHHVPVVWSVSFRHDGLASRRRSGYRNRCGRRPRPSAEAGVQRARAARRFAARRSCASVAGTRSRLTLADATRCRACGRGSAEAAATASADSRFSGHSLRPAPVWPRSPVRRTRDTSASADRSRRQVRAGLLRHDVRGVPGGPVLVSHSLCQPFLEPMPVRFSCSAWAASARRGALARSGVDANAVPPVSIRPGSRVVTSWTNHVRAAALPQNGRWSELEPGRSARSKIASTGVYESLRSAGVEAVSRSSRSFWVMRRFWSFLSDWFSIWRIRSRVTLNVRPTSLSVRGCSPPRP
jgi:hypothetical protein